MRIGLWLAAGAAVALGAAAPATGPDAPVGPPPMTGETMAFVGVGGAHNCETFLGAVATERNVRPPGDNPNLFRTTLYGALMGWADGYLTAKNEDDRLQRLAGGSSTMAQRERWLELFCQANPHAGFFAAVYKLREHLVAEGE